MDKENMTIQGTLKNEELMLEFNNNENSCCLTIKDETISDCNKESLDLDGAQYCEFDANGNFIDGIEADCNDIKLFASSVESDSYDCTERGELSACTCVDCDMTAICCSVMLFI